MNKNDHAAKVDHGAPGNRVTTAMKICKRRIIKRTCACVVFCVSSSMNLQAGAIDPVLAPGSTMVTLQQIYEGVDRLESLESPKLLSDSTTEMMEGYYNDTTLDTVEPDLAASNIPAGVVIFGITGTANMVVSPANMALIPAGEFVMGDALDNTSAALPLHTNYISAFYMDQYEVTKALWDAIKAHNGGNGYSYANTGLGKATNHPVHTVIWYDAVKWCNARSEMEGLAPVYYTDAGFTTVYKTGEVAPHANWSANGYRLPTEAEWEKAARGGVSSKRFPWGDKVKHNDANYFSSASYAYDTSYTRSYHPTFNNASTPYTSPVGYFAPNGYGLYDMAGNVFEWCWDWYGSSYYSSSPSTDPKGPSSGSNRVLRGGSWLSNAFYTRVALRYYNFPDYEYNFIGFRCARGL